MGHNGTVRKLVPFQTRLSTFLDQKRYALLSDYQTLGIGKGDSSVTKTRLKIAQIEVDDTIAPPKSAWSAH